jgi:hypothetical protein
VPPCVRYGTTCSVIWYTIGSVSCSVEWGLASHIVAYFVTYLVKCLNHMVQEGMLVQEILALQAGSFVWETVAKHDILLIRVLYPGYRGMPIMAHARKMAPDMPRLLVAVPESSSTR